MGHHAPVFGLVCRLLEISRDDAGQLFLFNHLRTLGSAAVRLGIVGPMEAQRMQHSMTPLAKQVWSDCATIPVEEAAQTAPLLDLWQSGQDRLYSRLFQS